MKTLLAFIILIILIFLSLFLIGFIFVTLPRILDDWYYSIFFRKSNKELEEKGYIQRDKKFQIDIDGVTYNGYIESDSWDEDGCDAYVDMYLVLYKYEHKKLWNLIPYKKKIIIGKQSIYSFQSFHHCTGSTNDLYANGKCWYTAENIREWGKLALQII